MSRVAYGQKGYIGASMSANARAAYEAGEMPRSKWTKAAILGALRGYCDEMDLLYDPAVESETRAALFDGSSPTRPGTHRRYARETGFFALDGPPWSGRSASSGRGGGRARRIGRRLRPRCRGGTASEEAECLFSTASPAPIWRHGVQAFHPELCERRVSKRRKQELVVYRLPDGSEPSGYAEMSVRRTMRTAAMWCRRFSYPARAGIARGAISTSTRPSGNSQRRREGPRPFARRPKLMQDEARRAAIRETRHRACTAPILKSIKEIHR
ncbi:MAG: hypothetical protein ACLT98_00200 [Eggerthellaceae bacterium]